MLIRGLSAFRPRKFHLRYVIVGGLCALLQVPAADAKRDSVSPGMIPQRDAAEKSMPQIRIKRLKPADPESTEVMLARRGLRDPGKPQVLS